MQKKHTDECRRDQLRELVSSKDSQGEGTTCKPNFMIAREQGGSEKKKGNNTGESPEKKTSSTGDMTKGETRSLEVSSALEAWGSGET